MKIFLVLLLCLLYSNDMLPQWYSQNPLTITSDLSLVNFISPTTGWIFATDSTVYKTTNTGQSWERTDIAPGRSLKSICFSDSLTGWIVGNNGLILKSSDSGDSWFKYSDSIYPNLCGIYFTSELTGYCIGSSGTLLKTTNRGISWYHQYSGTNADLLCLSFLNSQFGVISGSDSTMLRTTDFGLNWMKLVTPSAMTNIAFSDPNRIWANSKNNMAYSSTNGGISWSIFSNSGPFFFAFHNGKGFYTRYNSIFKYTGGSTWEEIATVGSPRYLHLLGDNNFWAVGDDGTLLHSTDGGNNWVSLNGIQRSLKRLFFVSPDTGWTYANELLFRTTTGGLNWDFFTNHNYQQIKKLFFISRVTGWILGFNYYSSSGYDSYISKTTDGGISWKDQDSMYYAYTQKLLYFINPNHGYYSYDSSGVTILKKTTDGGANWKISRMDPSSGEMFFLNDSIGWFILGENTQEALLLKTTDAGNSWNSSNLPANFLPMNVYFISTDTGFVLGLGLYKTVDGGNNWNPVLNGEYVYQMHFSNSLHGYLLGSEKYFESLDGGNSWFQLFPTNIAHPYYRHFYFLKNSDLGWMGINDCLIYSTTNLTSVNEIIYETSSNKKHFDLQQNYPNPFNPITTIKYELKQRMFVTLKLYNAIGKEILVLINEEQEKGQYSFNLNMNSKNLPSGVYIYHFSTFKFSDAKKMIYLK